MARPEEAEEDIAADVLPVQVTEPATPLALDDLFPWHKPRKQLVRKDLWLRLTRALLQRLKNQGFVTAVPQNAARGSAEESRAEIRCLTLPGIDYLDARILGEECNTQGCRLSVLGLLSGGENSRHVARARVRQEGLVQAGYITDRSNTLARPLEEACAGGAIRELRQRAPFHIVNIDACGSVAPPSAEHARRLVEAIHGIVELQLARCTHRWLLFLTVEGRANEVHSETMDAFCASIVENAEKSSQFAEAASDTLQPGTADIKAAIAHAKAAGQRAFLALFAMGMGKWLLHFAEQKQWSVRMDRAFCHSTNVPGEPAPTMCALAFEFIPPTPGLIDNSGASRRAPSEAGAHPENPSVIVAASVKAMSNADELMNADATLKDGLREETRNLLKEAGYSEAALAKLAEF